MNEDFFYGSLVGGGWLFFVYLFILFLLSRKRLLTSNLFLVLSFSFVMHVLALNIYAASPSDSSVNFFPNATLVFPYDVGPPFVYFFSGVLKLIGFNTLLSQFYFCNSLGFLGSYFYFKTYIRFAQSANFTAYEYHYYPAYMVIWMWPSFLFWTTGIAKDSGMFFALSIIFYGIVIWKDYKAKSIFLLMVGLLFVWFLRPQIFCVLLGAAIFLGIFSRRVSMKVRLVLLIVFIFFFIYLLPQIFVYGGIADITDITKRGIEGQIDQSGGTAIDVPTKDPTLMLLFLPYLIVANLFLPIFFGVRNVIGVLASVENLLFVYLCYVYFQYRARLLELFSIKRRLLLNYIECTLVFGMAFIGMLNTNLGLAVRQKTMFTGPFFVLIALALVLRRRVFLQRKCGQ